MFISPAHEQVETNEGLNILHCTYAHSAFSLLVGNSYLKEQKNVLPVSIGHKQTAYSGGKLQKSHYWSKCIDFLLKLF